MKARKSVAVKAKVVGHLTEDDEKAVLPLVASCDFIDEHVRKVFRLNAYAAAATNPVTTVAIYIDVF